MDCSLPGSSVNGIPQKRNTGVGSHYLLQGNLPNPGIKPRSPTLQVDSLPSELPGKHLRGKPEPKKERDSRDHMAEVRPEWGTEGKGGRMDCACYLRDTELGALETWTLSLPPIQRGQFYPHFIPEKTEAQRGELPYSRSPSKWMAEPSFRHPDSSPQWAQSLRLDGGLLMAGWGLGEWCRVLPDCFLPY